MSNTLQRIIYESETLKRCQQRREDYSFNSFSKSVNLCKTDRKDAFELAYYADQMQLSSFDPNHDEDYQKKTQSREKQVNNACRYQNVL